jgi:hypothetical protein
VESLSIATLNELVKLDRKKWRIYWRERPEKFFPNGKCGPQANAKKWNGRFSGKEAFNTPTSHGYFAGAIFGREYKAHRVIWAIVNGEWPKGEIDHINGIKCDNRIENLRLVTPMENQRNRPMPKTNTSGVIGVMRFWRGWKAHIGNGKTQEIIGVYDCFWRAVIARKEAEKKYGYHQNHGRR